MTDKDFRSSPLLDTARKLHRLLAQQDIACLIIGGLPAIRKEAKRIGKEVRPRIKRSP